MEDRRKEITRNYSST
ncbi:Protein of unknown function [Pyronema omphalodes CBS 100304]|uniref:Uncharacterized protein n=1 Tax=Pyronema omphalodes (strain CBS 100304) TaxID=1076935 RepID=U4KZN0_PYROM|nr:Protein of unknown function [Pyronema omphalodes CBS 100304]